MACAQGQAEKNARLGRFMDELYFGGPYDRLHQQDKKLTRWQGPMRVAVSGEQVEEHSPTIQKFLQHFAQITDLDISIVPPDSPQANVQLILEKDSLFPINAEFATCYVTIEGEESVIERGVIHISAYDPDDFDGCLAHEFMHLVGIRFHSAIVRSVMSPAHSEDNFTRWDLLALRILFDQRLRPGQQREEVIAMLPQALIEHEAKIEKFYR